MALSREKKEELQERMTLLGIFEKDLVEKFILGSGSGGQKVNKTSSCVYLCHGPTGLEVKCQRERSRDLNRYYARREICDQLEAIQQGAKSAKQQEQEKIRRQKRRRTRRQQEKMLEGKRSRSSTKSLRQPPGADD